MTYFRYSMLTPIVMAASCTTAAYDRERSHCAVHWHNLIPAKFEDRLFTEYRHDKEFSGTTVCRRINGQTICEHGYNTVMVPYTVVDQVDIHKKRRNAHIAACAETACEKSYGNPACKSPKKL